MTSGVTPAALGRMLKHNEREFGKIGCCWTLVGAVTSTAGCSRRSALLACGSDGKDEEVIAYREHVAHAQRHCLASEQQRIELCHAACNRVDVQVGFSRVARVADPGDERADRELFA